MAQPPAPRLQALARQDAQKYGLGDWFVRQISAESGWNPNARSSAGAQGIAQFIPSTAKAYGLSNPYDPAASLDAAARYDRDLLKQNNGNVARALSAYNSGNPNAYTDPNFAGGQTYNYVRTILGGTGAGAASSPSPAAGAPVAPVAPVQPVDPRGSLLKALTGAGGDNYTGFYKQLGQALKARTAAPAASQAGATNSGGFQPHPSGLAGGFLPGGATYKPGRLDQGHDFQTDPGAPLLAPGDGVVVAVKSDPHGFGPAYPVVRFTSGPYAGKTIYLGHTLATVKPGEQFRAGATLSRTGTSPVGNAQVPGWAEIGFAPGGVPGGFGQSTPF